MNQWQTLNPLVRISCRSFCDAKLAVSPLAERALMCSVLTSKNIVLVTLVPAHWSLAVHGETQRGSGATECQAVPVPAPPRPSLLPSAQGSAQGCEATEPSHQRDGRTQTCRFWYCAPLYCSFTVIKLCFYLPLTDWFIYFTLFIHHLFLYLICHYQNLQLHPFPLLSQFDFNQLIWMSYIRILGIRYSSVCFQLL